MSSQVMEREHSSGGSQNGSDAILEVKDLKKHFPISSGIVFQRQVGAVRFRAHMPGLGATDRRVQVRHEVAGIGEDHVH